MGRRSDGSRSDSPRRPGVARRALHLTQPGDSILILAGKGHNGEDARCAREHLPDRRVEVLEVPDAGGGLAQAGRAAGIAPGAGRGWPVRHRPEPAARAGVGRLHRARQRGALPVLAVDVPSGLNADTGEPQGAAIKAAVTLTVGAPKTGMLREAAWPFVGRLEVATDVGLAPCPHQSELQWTLPEDFADFPPAVRRRRTKAATATWRLSLAAWAITAPRCWRPAARNARNPG